MQLKEVIFNRIEQQSPIPDIRREAQTAHPRKERAKLAKKSKKVNSKNAQKEIKNFNKKIFMQRM